MNNERTFNSEFVINNFTEDERKFLVKKETLKEICDYADVSIVTEGVYIKPKPDGSLIRENNMRPLCLNITSHSKHNLTLAVKKIQMLLRNLDSKIKENHTDEDCLSEKITIGIEIFPAIFRMKSKILGQNNENVIYVKDETGAIMSLRGKGSGYYDDFGKESGEPLHILVNYKNKESMEEARKLIINLIETVQQDFQDTYGKYYPWPSKPEIIPIKNPEKTERRSTSSNREDVEIKKNSIAANIEKITVGISPVPSTYNLKSKIYGPGLMHAKHIRKTANALLLVEDKSTKEPPEPAYILVKYLKPELKDSARKLILNLIDTVHKDFILHHGTFPTKPQKPEIFPYDESIKTASKEESPPSKSPKKYERSSPITIVPPPPPPPKISKLFNVTRNQPDSSITSSNEKSDKVNLTKRAPIKPIKFQVNASASKTPKANIVIPPVNCFERATSPENSPSSDADSTPVTNEISIVDSKPIDVQINATTIPSPNEKINHISSIPVINSDPVFVQPIPSCLPQSQFPLPGQGNVRFDTFQPLSSSIPPTNAIPVKPTVRLAQNPLHFSPATPAVIPSFISPNISDYQVQTTQQFIKKRSKSPIDSFTENKKFCNSTSPTDVPTSVAPIDPVSNIPKKRDAVNTPRSRYLVPLMMAEPDSVRKHITLNPLANASKLPPQTKKSENCSNNNDINNLKASNSTTIKQEEKKQEKEKYVIVIDSEEDEDIYDNLPKKTNYVKKEVKKDDDIEKTKDVTEKTKDVTKRDMSVQTDDKLWKWQIKNIECACGRFTHVLTGIRSVHVQTIDSGYRR